ncbi:VOC family protein [Paraburkholderia sp.]|uniref:VOC family protein n=1 Tax=Paraburkholderia sp. TaxID=1926495 RepID=UPI002B002D03|nr:VOC family protein [Paraburkholderia sp.]
MHRAAKRSHTDAFPVFVGITDFKRAFDFYSAVMDTLGLRLKFRDDDACCAGWMAADAPRPLFVIARPYDGQPATVGNGQMLALLAADRGTVDCAHATALAYGGACEGSPGLRPHYHADYYGAYFRDPDGNKLCVCCHEPATTAAVQAAR